MNTWWSWIFWKVPGSTDWAWHGVSCKIGLLVIHYKSVSDWIYRILNDWHWILSTELSSSVWGLSTFSGSIYFIFKITAFTIALFSLLFRHVYVLRAKVNPSSQNTDLDSYDSRLHEHIFFKKYVSSVISDFKI